MQQLQGQHILILGLGASGMAMARWCVHCGAEVVVADTRAQQPQLQALQQELPAVRFVSAIGKTPHAMISMIRLTRVQELLQQTDLSVDAIAQKAGFQHVEYMSVAFRKAFGQPPGRYRRQHDRS